MTARNVAAIAASYALVASLAFLHGYLCRVWLERRQQEIAVLQPDLHIDLIDPHLAAYDWALDPAAAADAPLVATAGDYPPPQP